MKDKLPHGSDVSHAPRPKAVVIPERAEDILDSVLKALEFPTLLNGSEKIPKGFLPFFYAGHEYIFFALFHRVPGSRERQMLEGLKPFFNKALRPLVRPAVSIGIRPNHLTIAGLALSGAAGWFAYAGTWTAACIIAAAGSLLDGLDGIAARESGRKSAFGAVLDSCCDRLAETLLILGVLGFFLTSPAASLDKGVFSMALRSWGILFCYTAAALSLMVSYVKARCEGAGVTCSRGLLQRPERVILLCAGLLAGPPVMVWVLAAVSLLAAVTVVQRFFEAYRKSKGPAIK